MTQRRYTLGELRARHGLSQKTLGEKVGVTRLTMHLYEKNPERIRDMPYSLLAKVAEVLQVEIEEIYMGEGENGL